MIITFKMRKSLKNANIMCKIIGKIKSSILYIYGKIIFLLFIDEFGQVNTFVAGQS